MSAAQDDFIHVCKPHGYTNCWCDVEENPAILRGQLREAKEELATLKQRLEEAQGFREGHPSMCCGKCHDTLATLEAQLGRYREALLPFAADYFDNPDDVELNNGKHLLHRNRDCYDACIYFDDIRRAKAALSNEGPGVKHGS